MSAPITTRPSVSTAAGLAQGDAGPALPSGFGGDVGVFGVLAHEDAIAERDEQRREEGQ